MASGPGTRCRFSGRLSRISRMRCTTAVCEVMEAGGVLRARERACKTITSPGAASRKRHAPFLDPSERFAQGGSQVSVCPAGMLLCEEAASSLAARSIGLRFPCRLPPLWVVVFLKCSAGVPGRKDACSQRGRKTHEAKWRKCWKSQEKRLKQNSITITTSLI